MIRRNLPFLIPYLIVLLIAGYFLIQYDKADIHIYLNRFHHPFWDQFFRWITHLGDGLFAVGAVVILLFFNFGKAFITGLALATSTLITQFLKRIIYHEELRPGSFFRDYHLEIDLHYVPQVNLHSFNSFPSGHANTAFCLFLCLSYFTKKSLLKFVYFVIALLAAYSRVYLSQHFLIDIYFGSLWAVGLTLIILYLFNESRMEKVRWANKSLIRK